MASAPDAEPAPSPVNPGDLLAGKYRVQSVLGQGAMGVVVAAVHEQLSQKVALKFLLPEALKSEDAVARFTREARAMVKIQSEHIARVIDVGALENGAPYTVMEFLQGRDLGAILDEQGRLPIELATDYVLQACEAIAEAHANGIVHRDLKPANLFLTKRADGSSLVKVLDFGIAKALDDVSGAGATNAGTLLGSPYYMSPEQMRSSANVDRRSDIWALGVILFELISGRPVFVADTMPGLCGAILSDPPTPLRELVPEAPEALEAVILKCLERDLDKRYQTVAEVARGLMRFAPKSSRVSVERVSRLYGEAALPESIPAPPPSQMAVSQGGRTTGPWAETQNEPPPRRKLGALGMGAGALVAVAAIAAVLGQRKPPVVEPPPAAAQVIAAPVAPPPPPPPAAAPQPEVVPAPIATAEPAEPPAAAPEPAPSAASAPVAAPRPTVAKSTARPKAPVVKAAAAAKSSSGGTVDPLDGRK